jgi:hypothetical protein
MIPTKNQESTQVLRKDKYFLLLMWHPLWYRIMVTGGT